MKTDDKIDFVVAWVDDSDPEWIKSKNYYLNKLQNIEPQGESNIDVDEIRYRDWGLLKYWFRAVEQYAPWVNKIYFVTCGHVPEWMNMEAEKLVFVKHEDFIPHKYLPTFNANPIELNFHRIKGLSEQFVYFNDDFFLTASVKPEDFFKNGLPCDSFAEKPIAFPIRELYNNLRINDLVFANQHFNRRVVNKKLWYKRFSLKHPYDSIRNLLMSCFRSNSYFGIATHHLPQSYLKRTLEEVWEADYELMDETSSHKFRDIRDVTQFSLKFWQLLNGRFEVYNKSKFGKLYKIGEDCEEACETIKKRTLKTVCLNDSGVTDFEKTKAMLIEAFEEVLPNKSVYEI